MNLSNTENVMQDGRAFVAKLVIISGEKATFSAYLTWDDQRIVRVEGRSLKEVLQLIEQQCEAWLE